MITDAIVVLLVIGGIIYLIAHMFIKANREKLAAKAPAGVVIEPGDTKHEITAKSQQYRQLLKCVAILDHLKSDQDVRPFIPKHMLNDMDGIVDQFYKN